MNSNASKATSIIKAQAEDIKTGFQNPTSVYALLMLTLMYFCLQLDRSIIAIVMGPIKQEFGLTDTQLGFLPLAFSLVFAVAGIPLGLLSDRGNRRNVIASCLFFFSTMTALCGLVQSYVQLLLVRFGVGAGEAGGGPAAMSMLTDYFPAHQRARAMSIYYLSSPVSMLVLFVVGAWVTTHYGWRMTFLVAGAPGVLIGVLMFLTVPEAPRALAKNTDAAAGLRATFTFVMRQRALVHLILGILLTALSSASVVIWFIAFLARSHGMPLTQSGWLVGILLGLVSFVGVCCGGFLADWLGRDRLARRTQLLAVASLISAPLLLGMLFSPTAAVMTVCFSLWAFTSSIWYGPSYSLIQSLVGPRQRATLASIVYMLTAIVSAGMGPQLVGLFSDVLTPVFGQQSLRWALTIAVVSHLWSAWHYWRAGRDLERNLQYVNS